ncbi:scp-like extracellular protein, putative [Ichthyophthirius multifiliis]|uniref:Scp-like extracellular protein, putative n=1 Tax=Ichthyophthirius multifiliis TaxID=5932 RepID=G0QWE6_ICHMU|nr:scp-like extracellular protein, putative [Ichthyophthirius multifiliis]EGR30463.1 scp-like extracellular protein, putative [Ichthyophthirius multifiliis]|eukprot:XP_004032050.1 scp-like extracellular protein, putative [Ichthyophthirius multifiliis]
MGKSAKPENSGDNLQNQTNKIYNKLTGLGYAVAYNYNVSQDILPKISALQTEIGKKALKDDVKEKNQKIKEKLVKDFDEMKKYFEKKIVNLEAKLNDKINTFEDRTQNIEKKTLWKIQDCEEMLKKRITEEYVDDSCIALEEKLKRDVFSLIQNDSDKIERIEVQLNSKMKQIEDLQCEKQKSIKKQLKDLEDLVNQSYLKGQIFEDFKKFNSTNLTELSKRLYEVEKKNDLAGQLERQNIRIKSLEDKISDFEKDIIQKLHDIQIQYNNQSKSYKINDNQQSQNSNIDPHKICQIDSDLQRTMEEVRKQKQQTDELKNSLQNQSQNENCSIITTKKLHSINNLNCLSCGIPKHNIQQGRTTGTFRADLGQNTHELLITKSNNQFKTQNYMDQTKIQRPQTAQETQNGKNFLRPESAKK